MRTVLLLVCSGLIASSAFAQKIPKTLLFEGENFIRRDADKSRDAVRYFYYPRWSNKEGWYKRFAASKYLKRTSTMDVLKPFLEQSGAAGVQLFAASGKTAQEDVAVYFHQWSRGMDVLQVNVVRFSYEESEGAVYGYHFSLRQDASPIESLQTFTEAAGRKRNHWLASIARIPNGLENLHGWDVAPAATREVTKPDKKVALDRYPQELIATLAAKLSLVKYTPGEAVDTSELDVGPLVGTPRDLLRRVLGEPSYCTARKAGSESTVGRSEPCRSESDLVYRFYQLPENSRGGGPELHLSFDESATCSAAAWVFTQ